MIKYKFFKDNNKIIAVSSYAGRPVKGYAKCNPQDTFDENKGKELAAARCNQKVARKRQHHAIYKLAEARKQLKIAENRYRKMVCYLDDAIYALNEANDELIYLEASM